MIWPLYPEELWQGSPPSFMRKLLLFQIVQQRLLLLLQALHNRWHWWSKWFYPQIFQEVGSDSPRSSRGGEDQEKPYMSLVESRPSSTKTLLTQVMLMVIGNWTHWNQVDPKGPHREVRSPWLLVVDNDRLILTQQILSFAQTSSDTVAYSPLDSGVIVESGKVTTCPISLHHGQNHQKWQCTFQSVLKPFTCCCSRW